MTYTYPCGYSVDISPADVSKMLDVVDVRLVDEAPQVLIRDEWVNLGRTDLMDNVSTVRCFGTLEEAKAFVAELQLSNHGARLIHGGIFVVDSMTDG
jgi:hypothetical protein